MQPAIDDGLLCGFGPVPVAEHHVRASDQHLARLAVFHVVSIGIRHAHVGVEERLSTRTGSLDCIITNDETRGTAGFGEAIDLVNFDTHGLVCLDERHGHRRSAAHNPTQRRRIMVLGVIHGQHELQHGRHHERGGDLFAADELPGKLWVKGFEHHQCHPPIERAEQWGERSHMEHWQRDEIAICVVRVGRRDNGEQGPKDRVMGMHDSLREPGGTGGVHDEHEVIVGPPDGWFGIRCRSAPLIEAAGVVRGRTADLHPRFDQRAVATAIEFGSDRAELLGEQQHFGAGVGEDELKLVGHQPPVEWHDDGTDFGGSEEASHELGTVHEQ